MSEQARIWGQHDWLRDSSGRYWLLGDDIAGLETSHASKLSLYDVESANDLNPEIWSEGGYHTVDNSAIICHVWWSTTDGLVL